METGYPVGVLHPRRLGIRCGWHALLPLTTEDQGHERLTMRLRQTAAPDKGTPVPCPARARGPTHRLGSLAAPGVVGSGQDDAIEIGSIVLIERPGAGKVSTTQVALLGLLPSLPLPSAG